MPGRKGLLSNKTSSKVPKTSTQKKRWIRARQIVTKETGARSDKQVPWGVVQKIYKNENTAGKTAKKKDVTTAKITKSGKKYRKELKS